MLIFLMVVGRILAHWTRGVSLDASIFGSADYLIREACRDGFFRLKQDSWVASALMQFHLGDEAVGWCSRVERVSILGTLYQWQP